MQAMQRKVREIEYIVHFTISLRISSASTFIVIKVSLGR